jgi:hypothetical protein
MATLPLMNLSEDLLSLFWLYAALQHCCCASVINFAIDNSVAFGSSLYTP